MIALNKWLLSGTQLARRIVWVWWETERRLLACIAGKADIVDTVASCRRR